MRGGDAGFTREGCATCGLTGCRVFHVAAGPLEGDPRRVCRQHFATDSHPHAGAGGGAFARMTVCWVLRVKAVTVVALWLCGGVSGPGKGRSHGGVGASAAGSGRSVRHAPRRHESLQHGARGFGGVDPPVACAAQRLTGPCLRHPSLPALPLSIGLATGHAARKKAASKQPERH